MIKNHLFLNFSFSLMKWFAQQPHKYLRIVLDNKYLRIIHKNIKQHSLNHLQFRVGVFEFEMRNRDEVITNQSNVELAPQNEWKQDLFVRCLP